ncbi:hypothetical protein M4D70_26130 [Brevibacillus borstelensis]|uniref:hypothetical protein n=1 Tax=Brevibacillus borstelensis TaxID=45462 RepID=UPI0020401C22|nr:hypothetical protein [Brevibacillus borstelensis]MCM3625649.1 hypothetical protein [Brevibacillus borstelensis]
MSNVKRAIKELLMPSPDDVRFSITISDYDNVRAEYLAKKVGLSRAALMSQLAVAALSDLEEELGLNPDDTTTEYGLRCREGWDDWDFEELRNAPSTRKVEEAWGDKAGEGADA